MTAMMKVIGGTRLVKAATNVVDVRTKLSAYKFCAIGPLHDLNYEK